MSYKIIYQENGIKKSKIISEQEYLNKEFPSNIIKIRKRYLKANFEIFNTLNQKKLNELFYELSIMLEANILLEDALDILLENQKDKKIVSFLETIKYSFLNSQDIYKNLESFSISHLVKSFLRLSQSSGNITQNINLLSKILNENYELKKSIYKTFAYPILLFVSFFFALIGIFKYVLPKFEFMFSQTKMELSYATKSLFFVKDIFENHLILIFILLVIFIFALRLFYKKSQKFKFFIHKSLCNSLLLFSDIYRLKVLYIYFLFLDVLLQSKYEFNESLTQAKVSINNQYVLARISQIENLLKSGKSIAFAFSHVKLFDEVTQNLIRTGEMSNSLSITIQKINTIYKKRVDDKLKLFSVIIEPVLFLMIMTLIIWIILAIFVPLWSMGDMLKI